jgi:hypothetical protein
LWLPTFLGTQNIPLSDPVPEVREGGGRNEDKSSPARGRRMGDGTGLDRQVCVPPRVVGCLLSIHRPCAPGAFAPGEMALAGWGAAGWMTMRWGRFRRPVPSGNGGYALLICRGGARSRAASTSTSKGRRDGRRVFASHRRDSIISWCATLRVHSLLHFPPAACRERASHCCL